MASDKETISNLIPCIDSHCDKQGTTVDGNMEDGPEPAQCQFCYEVRFPLIDSLTHLLNRERLEAEITNLEALKNYMVGGSATFVDWVNYLNQRIADLKKQRRIANNMGGY